jgi:hypothetical protein
MAWTTPTTVTAGQVLTAARYNQDTVDNMLMGNPVFTNEAARDAVITSPSEGQSVYLTTPTVPAATGPTTDVPSGVRTIYNGSVWVCVTPVSSFNVTTGTTSSTSYTPTLASESGGNPSVTLVTGTTALVALRGSITNSGGTGANNFIAVAVSGAGTVAASDPNAIFTQVSAVTRLSQTFVISGLTAGTNTFTMQYKVSGNTGSFGSRGIIVQGIA